MGMFDSTHTIEVKQQNRGVQFLVGCVALYFLFRWLVTGRLLSLAMLSWLRFSGQEPAGLESASAVIIPIILDLVIGLGAIVIALGSGVWAIAWDLISGILESLAAWRAHRAALANATEVALSAASTAAGAAAGSAAGTSVTSSVGAAVEGAINFTALKQYLSQFESRLASIESSTVLSEKAKAADAVIGGVDLQSLIEENRLLKTRISVLEGN